MKGPIKRRHFKIQILPVQGGTLSSRACALEPTLSQQPSDIVRYELVPSIRKHNRPTIERSTKRWADSDFVVLNQSRFASLNLLSLVIVKEGNVFSSYLVHVKNMQKLSGGWLKICNIFKQTKKHTNCEWAGVWTLGICWATGGSITQ